MKREIQKSIAWLILGVFIQFGAAAQNQAPTTLGKVSISSPNAAALGKYGDVNVGYQTGTPQVSVPVYTLKEGPLSLPVSLSYHASGIRVMETASSVGMGWSLQAGGMITRTVKGNVDERGFGAVSNQSHGYYSDYGYYNYLFVPGEVGSGCNESLTQPGNMSPNDQYFMLGIKDGEPDMFTFNFNGYSGKFFFNDDRTPVIVPEQDIKIETDLVNSGDPLTTFILTTPDGVKYYFGKNQTPGNGGVDAVEVTSSCDANAGPSFGSAYSSWYLVKIVSPDQLFSITLKYDEEKYSSYTLALKPLDGAEIFEKEYSLVKNYMKGVRLSKISSSTTDVTFVPGVLRQDLSNYNPAVNSMADDPNTEAKTVGEIQIQNTAGNGINCKKFKLTYGYFEDNVTPFPSVLFNLPTTSDKKKLRLDAVQEFSCDETQSTPPYTFNYYGELVSRGISFAQDHWGFYNGVTTNTTMIPTFTVNGNDFKMGADRESRWPEMRGGTLNKITYPTGGSTDFVFEPNKTWVTATRKNLVTTGSYGVGFDQNNIANYPNVSLSSNTYRITLTNNNCSAPYTACGAGVYLQSNDGAVTYSMLVAAGGGESATAVFTAPSPGVYRIHLQRDNSIQSGVGATAVLQEIVPVQVNGNEIVGGLRIQKIINHDNISSQGDITTEYRYEDQAGKSTGVLYSKPVYVSVVRNDVVKNYGRGGDPNWCNPNGCVTCVSPIYYKSPSTIRPMETLQGGHIGYNEVKTFKSGLGSSVYRFYGSDIWDLNTGDVCTRNVDLNCNLSIPNYPAAPQPFEYKRGEMKYEGHFNEAGQLLKYTWYYPEYTDNALKTPGISHMNFGLATFTEYEISTKRKIQMKVDETIVNPVTGTLLTTSNTSFFESTWHRQPTRTLAVNSKGETIETKYKYAFDYRASGCDPQTNCLQAYQTAVTTAQNTLNYQLYTCVSSASCNCKLNALHQYRRDVSIARAAYRSCMQSNASSFASCFNTAMTNASAELKPVLELQAKNMNMPVEVTAWKNSQLLSATYTKYGYSTSVPGMVYPVKAYAIPLASPSASFSPAAVSGNTIARDSRYAEEVTVRTENGNTVEVTGKDGIITAYIWAYNNTLPVAKAVGADYNALKAAYDAVGGNLSDFRSHSYLSAAMVSTYVYTPEVGITKETDPRGRNIFYEYDKMNRLYLVRDHDSNIIRRICYNYAGQPEACPINTSNNLASWWATGRTRCKPCPANGNYITNMLQQEERDINQQSATYNTLRWTDIGISTTCDVNPDWQNTSTPVRCRLSSTGQNTGEQEQEQMNMNPCSSTYMQLRWVVIGVNYTLCPLNAGCNSGNCTGANKKCINNVCETGSKVYTASVYNPSTGLWTCTYHYHWSDGSNSPNYTETSTSNCLGGSTD